MRVMHPGKKLARLLHLGALGAIASLLCSCHGGAPPANPVQCAILVQAQVAIPNLLGGTQTYNEGGVSVAGSWVSDLGTSNCTGSLTNVSGTTAFGTGIYQANAVKMNANWQVAWSWANTNFSACPPYSTQKPVPDSGAVFNNVCHL